MSTENNEKTEHNPDVVKVEASGLYGSLGTDAGAELLEAANRDIVPDGTPTVDGYPVVHTTIIVGFPGIGKTEAIQELETLGSVKELHISYEENVAHDYMEQVEYWIGKVNYLILNPRLAVRRALQFRGLPFHLVYPNPAHKELFLSRLTGDGSHWFKWLAEGENWEETLKGFVNQRNAIRHVLEVGETMSTYRVIKDITDSQLMWMKLEKLTTLDDKTVADTKQVLGLDLKEQQKWDRKTFLKITNQQQREDYMKCAFSFIPQRGFINVRYRVDNPYAASILLGSIYTKSDFYVNMEGQPMHEDWNEYVSVLGMHISEIDTSGAELFGESEKHMIEAAMNIIRRKFRRDEQR